jgi:hypothetical protein
VVLRVQKRGPEPPRDAKVRELRAASHVDEDVLRFEIAVDDLRVARVVEIVHGVGDVDRHR